MDQNTNSENIEDASIRFGKILSHPPPGEEIVISGMSAVLPKCDDIEEFHNNLLTKTDMITHLPNESVEMPTGIGKLKDATRFDTGFFGIHKKHTLTLNPLCKLLLERSIECIFDAGLNPLDLEGTKTGVFVGICCAEAENHWFLKEHVKNSNTILGNIKSSYASRISHYLKLKGPSLTLDTACSSSLFALETAYKSIRMGHCDAAIVGGANLTLSNGLTRQFASLGVLSMNGSCRPFDVDGKGYVRSEAIATVLLQRARDSKRIYATLIHTKTNCDGYKEQGITYPSGVAQFNLLKDIYTESQIDPSKMSFIEAHGTGTPVGDPEEVNMIDAFFATNRSTPLLVGSVKSSIGHSEPTSGLCSIIKVIFAFQTNNITPNINYNRPRKDITGISEGRLEIVRENTPFRDENGLVGLSSFGFGGANCHVILKHHTKVKNDDNNRAKNFPRLVFVSGRTRDAVRILLEDIGSKNDMEHIGLIHNVFRKPIKNHLYRGYVIIYKDCTLKKSVKSFDPRKNLLHIHFGGSMKISAEEFCSLLDIPALNVFKSRLCQLFDARGLSIENVIVTLTNSNKANILISLIVQLLVAELLKVLEIHYQGISGHLFGRFISAYFQNLVSLEECLDYIFIFTCTNDFKNILEKLKNGGGEFTEYDTSKNIILLEKISKDITSVNKDSMILNIGEPLPAFQRNNLKTLNVNCNKGIITGLLEVVGSLFEYGLQPQIQKLYPKVHFPVNRGTPMISPKIKWSHTYKHFVPLFGLGCSMDATPANEFKIRVQEYPWTPLDGHIIDGRNLFPATGYLQLAWSVLGNVLDRDITLFSVVFENCKFKKACTLPNPSTTFALKLMVMIQIDSGNFEISEGDVPVVTGKIMVGQDQSDVLPPLKFIEECNENNVLYTRDIYKELRLRGYHYQGMFKAITKCNLSATHGKILWKDNWFAFMDNMLQMKILGEDTRNLYVPTSIAKVIINPGEHLRYVESLKKDDSAPVEIPVIVNHVSGEIRSGGIKIQGLLASSVSRKKNIAVPVLEKYQFVPNKAKLKLEESVRVCMQLALENNCGLKIKTVEVIDEATEDGSQPLGPIIIRVLGDQPMVQGDIKILSSRQILDIDIEVEDNKLTYETDCTIIIGSKLLARPMLQDAVKALSETGFLLSREKPNEDLAEIKYPTLTVLNILETCDEKLVFLRKNLTNIKSNSTAFIKVDRKLSEFGWLREVKQAVKSEKDIVLWSKNEPQNGIIGLVNCLRREPGCQNIRSLLVLDKAPDFDPKDPFYKKQLEKGMAVNIYKNGRWGTYRHFLLDKESEVKTQHCFANSTVPGDLSTIKWIEGPLSWTTKSDLDEPLIEVHYSSLNFRDVMIASGRINAIKTGDRREQECVIGFEYSGKTASGRRVMGVLGQGTLATMVKAHPDLLWTVPESWSLKDAATVPIVYCTCLYSLFIIAKIKRGDTILIHSGTGSIGLSAIHLCLHLGCTVFTTVGTEEKRLYIKQNFPQISERHIGNSRDISFEKMVMRETNGKGVDIVLNSLTEEKLFASVRCLAKNGRFLEIGKFDLMNDNQLNLLSFEDGRSYHGIMLDTMINGTDQFKKGINKLLQKYIDSGAVKPLKRTIFKAPEVVQAFRYMTTGKHIGKVLVEIRHEEEINPSRISQTWMGLPRYFCDPSKTYIICGGLGGFGLELADWLILRGAINVVLTSRKGISTGYQRYRISIWKNYGCNITISTHDITKECGCKQLLAEANALAPVAAIFNLAVVLRDAILENQTEESFAVSFGAKAYATQHLDEVSRIMCPELRDFVVFSSVSCGRGNAGQSNYGMSNSVMERICEKRRKEGYPALAIQWGAVGDVGLVAELQEDDKELEIGGTLQQRISNCLQVMDIFLRQNEAAIVSSMVVAEKKTSASSGNVIEIVGAILGIRDIKLVSTHSTLAELGMDSMTGVEVKQTLEREYNIFLTPKEMRSITLARIQELQESNNVEPIFKKDELTLDLTSILKCLLETGKQMNPLIRLETLPTKKSPLSLPKIFMLPGIEGVCYELQNLSRQLEVQAYGFNYCCDAQENTIPKMADVLLPHIKEHLYPNEMFHIVGHSFGCDIALELASRLESLGHIGTVIMLDGSPLFLNELIIFMAGGDMSTTNLENVLLSGAARIQLTEAETMRIMQEITKLSTFQEKILLLSSHMKFNESFTEQYLFEASLSTRKRMEGSCTYIPKLRPLKSKGILCKPTSITLHMDAEDYGLGQYFEQPIDTKVFDGTHTSILQNKDLAKTIMQGLKNGY